MKIIPMELDDISHRPSMEPIPSLCNSQPANRLLKQTDPIRRTQSRRLGMPTSMDYLHASREFLSIGGKRRPVLRRAHEDYPDGT
jgi:hypothetical protein